jgi:hypothetical protein
MKMLAIPAMMLAFATGAAAETPNGGTGTDRMICRTTGELGSRLNRTRTCLSQAEWDARARSQRNEIDRAQTRHINYVAIGTGPAGQNQ